MADTAGTDYSFLSDPHEREWLTTVAPIDVLANAHRIYDYMREAGLAVDSFTRELAFQKAAAALNLDYDVLYNAWLHEMPVGPAALRRARGLTKG